MIFPAPVRARTSSRFVSAASLPAAFLAAGFLLAGAAPASSSAGQDGIEVIWHAKPFDAGAPPADLPEPAKAAVAEWKAWAKKSGYKMTFDNDARVLVLTAPKGRPAQDAMQLVNSAVTWFDGVLPSVKASPPKAATPAATKATAPKTSTSTKPGAKPPPPKTNEPIPEDPEKAPPVIEPPKGGKGGASKKAGGAAPPVAEGQSWGGGSSVPDARTVVFIALQDEKDQENVLGFLGETHPDLKEWASKAGRDVGFVIENPLVGAYVQNANGQEEWNPDHELLNRVVRLLTLNRFGQLPNWLVHGIAWEAETARDKTIYVYPYRNEFVPVTEHESWPSELAREYKDRGPKKPMQIEELTRWNRGTWNSSSARMAFGLVHYLATAKKAAFAGALADFRVLYDEGNRKAGEDGTWTRDPNWAPGPEAQLSILKSRCGEKVLEDASAWLASQGSSAARKATEAAGKSAPVKD